MAENANKSKRMYKLVYDRAGCIGAAACEAVYPLRWTMASSDGKADLIDGKQVDQSQIYEYYFDESELDKIMGSATVCPVNVIHIYDPDGNKLI